jgi:hypothetical protein
VLAAGRRLVWLGPEVGHPGDEPVGEFEERHGVIALATEGPLEPHHPVTLVGDHQLRLQVPVTGILLIEPQVAITSPDTLPRLRDLVDHGGVQQPCPGIPVPGLQAGDEALHQFTIAAHPGKLPLRSRATGAPRVCDHLAVSCMSW